MTKPGTTSRGAGRDGAGTPSGARGDGAAGHLGVPPGAGQGARRERPPGRHPGRHGPARQRPPAAGWRPCAGDPLRPPVREGRPPRVHRLGSSQAVVPLPGHAPDRAPGVLVAHDLGGARPGVVGRAGLRGGELRPQGRGHLRRRRVAAVAPGGRGRPRPHRVGRGPAVEQRGRRDARRVVPGAHAVAGGVHPAAVAEGDRTVGGVHERLPGAGAPRRRGGERIPQAVGPRTEEGPADLLVPAGERPPAGDRRLVPVPRPRPVRDRGARAGLRQLLRQQPPQPRVHRRIRGDLLRGAAPVHPPRRQVGRLLRPGSPRGPAALLRTPPEGAGRTAAAPHPAGGPGPRRPRGGGA